MRQTSSSGVRERSCPKLFRVLVLQYWRRELINCCENLTKRWRQHLFVTNARQGCTMDQALLLQPQILQLWQVCRNRLRLAILKLHLMASTTVRNVCTTGWHDGPSASPAITNFTMMAGMQESIAIRYNLAVAP